MWATMRALACERRQAMEYGTETVLGLVKSRLNRLKSDTSLDEYLLTMIEAAKGELARTGITLRWIWRCGDIRIGTAQTPCLHGWPSCGGRGG